MENLVPGDIGSQGKRVWGKGKGTLLSPVEQEQCAESWSWPFKGPALLRLVGMRELTRHLVIYLSEQSSAGISCCLFLSLVDLTGRRGRGLCCRMNIFLHVGTLLGSANFLPVAPSVPANGSNESCWRQHLCGAPWGGEAAWSPQEGLSSSRHQWDGACGVFSKLTKSPATCR